MILAALQTSGYQIFIQMYPQWISQRRDWWGRRDEEILRGTGLQLFNPFMWRFRCQRPCEWTVRHDVRLTEFQKFLQLDALAALTVLQTHVQRRSLQTEPAQPPALQVQRVFIAQTPDPLKILLQQVFSAGWDERLCRKTDRETDWKHGFIDLMVSGVQNVPERCTADRTNNINTLIINRINAAFHLPFGSWISGWEWYHVPLYLDLFVQEKKQILSKAMLLPFWIFYSGSVRISQLSESEIRFQGGIPDDVSDSKIPTSQ